jgi:hypothetical protein
VLVSFIQLLKRLTDPVALAIELMMVVIVPEVLATVAIAAAHRLIEAPVQRGGHAETRQHRLIYVQAQ